MKKDKLYPKKYGFTVELEVMKRKISRLAFKLFSILIITGFCINANAGNKSAKFKVPARGTIEYTLDVQQDFGDIEIKISDQSHHLNLKVYRPGSKSAYCQSSTWSSSIGLDNPMICRVDKANVKWMEPGKWRIVIEGAVHVGNVDKYPFVTALLNVSVGNSKPLLKGEGIDDENESTSSSGDLSTSYGNFKVKGDGKVNYYIDVPANTKRIDVILKNQSQHVGLKVFPPSRENPWCQGSTWTSSIGLYNPINCYWGGPDAGKHRIEISGQVQKHRLGEFPFVTGQLIIKIDGKGQGGSDTNGNESNDYETPPNHPEVEIPDDSEGSTPTVPEAGGWYPSASMLEYDCNLKGYIKKGDYDMYKFYFPGGKLKAYSKGNLDLVADLLSSDEEQLARDQLSGEGKNFKFEGNYPPGMYYIMIRVMYHGGQGDYELVLGNGKGWSFVEEN